MCVAEDAAFLLLFHVFMATSVEAKARAAFWHGSAEVCPGFPFVYEANMEVLTFGWPQALPTWLGGWMVRFTVSAKSKCLA